MKFTRLTAALTLSLLSVSAAYGAKYSIVELPLGDKGVNQFSASINEQGQIATTVQSPFNPPIDPALLNFDSEALQDNLTDIDAARIGDFNPEDLAFVNALVRAGAGNQFVQQLANQLSYLVTDANTQFIPGFEPAEAPPNGLSLSMSTIARRINDASAVVGSSADPFYTLPYTNQEGTNLTYVVNDFGLRGFLQTNGQTFAILPDETTLGGISEAFDINNGFEIAGYGTTEVTDALRQAAENCQDPEQRGDAPVESCLHTLVLQSSFINNFQRRAMIWRFDAQGNEIARQTFGLVFTPEEDDTRSFASRAVAINDNGIAVGASSDFHPNDESRSFPTSHAAIFDGDQALGFIDKEEYVSSSSLDINNKDIVVGIATLRINGLSRNKLFVYDYRAQTTNVVSGFFESSSTTPRAINDNDLVVGEAEVEADPFSTSRRREAFLYDIAADDFTNLNDLVACDSNYKLVQANAINNKDEIVATAVVRRELRNIAGEVALDAEGNPVMTDVTVAVKLTPIAGGSIDECEVNSEPFERKGAGLDFWPLLLLGFISLFRRYQA